MRALRVVGCFLLGGGLVGSAVLSSDRGFPAAVAASGHPTVLIHDALIVDGMGNPPYRGSVRLHGDRVSSLGDLTPRPGEHVWDARGLVLVPGFIDLGADAELLKDQGIIEAALRRGVTTLVLGLDGEHPFPLAERFDRLRGNALPLNVASYAGLFTLYRAQGSEDLEAVQALLRREMEGGALGVASGVRTPASSRHGPSAATDPAGRLAGVAGDDSGPLAGGPAIDDLVNLARTAAAARGGYGADLPGSPDQFVHALDEAIRIGREAGMPVHVSGLERATGIPGAEAAHLLAILEDSRAAGIEVSADVHPAPGDEQALRLLAWPHASVRSGRGPAGTRDLGAFLRVLARTSGPRAVLSLEAAVHRMTEVPARNAGIRGASGGPRAGRGVIEPLAYADLVLLDPAALAATARDAQPAAPARDAQQPAAIVRVWVNGQVVVEEGALTGRRPGRTIPWPRM